MNGESVAELAGAMSGDEFFEAVIAATGATAQTLKGRKLSGYATLRDGLPVVFPGESVGKTITLTPERATLLLARSAGNRKIDNATSAGYVRYMRAGEWYNNSESLKIDKYGVLSDGHHRCLACISAGVPISTMLAIGGVGAGINTGKPRSVGDQRGMDGSPRDRSRAHIGCVRVLSMLDEGMVRLRMSQEEVCAIEDRHALALAWRRAAFRVSPHLWSAHWGAMCWAYPCAEAKVAEFGESVLHMESVRGTAAHALMSNPLAVLNRSASVRLRAESARGLMEKRSRTNSAESLARVTLIALMHHVRGEPCSKLFDADTGMDYFRALRRQMGQP